jgi:uncharacterized membrane protein
MSQAEVPVRPLRRTWMLFSSIRPALLFTLLSLMFGTLVAFVSPPLRGPDESAHVLRAMSVAQGELRPQTADAEGRKGVRLAPRLYSGFAFFEQVRRSEKNDQFGYRDVFERYRAAPPHATAQGPEQDPVFVRFEGSEGYSPVAYLPQALGAFVAQAMGLGFLPTLYLMRLTGVAALTAAIAFAIARTGALGWPLLAIAMLPSALYGRSVISADGMAFASSLVVISLFLQGLRRSESGRSGRAVWTALCALTKPPNLAFALLELFIPAKQFSAWPIKLIVIAPAVALAVGWTWLSSADVAAWRLQELYGFDAHQLDPMRNLALIVADPLLFARKVVATLTKVIFTGEFVRQIVGVLGLFDVVLQGWVYPTIIVLVIGCFAASAGTDMAHRGWAATGALVCTLAYTAALILIFYLVWTPAKAETIWGLQGRYLLPILPLLAIMIAAAGRLLPAGAAPAAAVLSAVLSGAATLEAVLRVDWAH